MKKPSPKNILSALVVTILAALTLMTVYAVFPTATEIRQFISRATTQATGSVPAEDVLSWPIVLRDSISAVLIVLAVILYTLFCSDILQKHALFAKKQSRRLFSIGLILLIDSAISFSIDCVSTLSTSPISVSTATGVLPFSPWILITSLLSLSLSFIFERARLLQEDADDIL